MRHGIGECGGHHKPRPVERLSRFECGAWNLPGQDCSRAGPIVRELEDRSSDGAGTAELFVLAGHIPKDVPLSAPAVKDEAADVRAEGELRAVQVLHPAGEEIAGHRPDQSPDRHEDNAIHTPRLNTPPGA